VHDPPPSVRSATAAAGGPVRDGFGADTRTLTVKVPPIPRRRRRRAVDDQPVLDRQLSELIDQHADAVYRVAFGILHDRGLAEDVVQETMVKAWRSLDTFRGDSSLRTWVLRIAHHTSISAVRRRRDQAMAPEDLPDSPSDEDPGARAAARDELRAVGDALSGLDEVTRSIVVLREVEGLSYQQIADTLEIPVPTVKTRLLRARRTLQAAAGRHQEQRDD
jgi:RNA polymerase sigma-70 factor (ECF subfamily)